MTHLQQIYMVCAQSRQAPIDTLLDLLCCDSSLLSILPEVLVAVPSYLQPGRQQGVVCLQSFPCPVHASSINDDPAPRELLQCK